MVRSDLCPQWWWFFSCRLFMATLHNIWPSAAAWHGCSRCSPLKQHEIMGWHPLKRHFYSLTLRIAGTRFGHKMRPRDVTLPSLLRWLWGQLWLQKAGQVLVHLIYLTAVGLHWTRTPAWKVLAEGSTLHKPAQLGVNWRVYGVDTPGSAVEPGS